MRNHSPAEVQPVVVVLNYLHFDATIVAAVVQTIAAGIGMDCYSVQLCIAAIVAQSVVGQIECRDFHWAELQTALVKSGRSSLADEAPPVAAIFK